MCPDISNEHSGSDRDEKIAFQYFQVHHPKIYLQGSKDQHNFEFCVGSQFLCQNFIDLIIFQEMLQIHPANQKKATKTIRQAMTRIREIRSSRTLGH